MRRAEVIVAGGGLAGIAAALRCADAGLDVMLAERRPVLGGATYSIDRDDRTIDNGQHVFLRCCTEYRGLLRRMGSENLTELQPSLEIPLVQPGGGVRRLRRGPGHAPLHLAPILLGLPGLSPVERLRAATAVLALGDVDPDDLRADERDLGEWLRQRRQSPRAIRLLWELIVRPTLNLRANEASLAMAARVFRTGLLERPDAGDIGWAVAPLRRVHGDAAASALAEAGVDVRLHAAVTAVEPRDEELVVTAGGDRIAAAAVIACMPPRHALRALPSEALDPGTADALGSSPIVNLHVVYDRPVTRLPFAAGARGPVQWVFDRSAASAGPGQYLAVTLSAADALADWPSARLRTLFAPALAELFPAAREARMTEFFVTRERHATFRAAPGSGRARPGPRTPVAGLYLAGAWTRTGWPDTMEGAVRSGRTAAAALLRDRATAPPARAAA
ncbi:MAG TPA: hydroxysqualene dehydroxylase HpnE [Gaiellales bacterium]|nr:hydroxysqualene dehydroxylase HpnE [Gaiellales bacterium]